MELLKEILSQVLLREEVNVIFPNLTLPVIELIELESLKILSKIKKIIENDNLSDFECIEGIVCVLEKAGSNGGNRHNFG